MGNGYSINCNPPPLLSDTLNHHKSWSMNSSVRLYPVYVFPHNIYNIHFIAQGQGMGCLLWVQLWTKLTLYFANKILKCTILEENLYIYTPCPMKLLVVLSASMVMSACMSICICHSFCSVTQVCFGISTSNFICTFPMPLSRSLFMFVVKNCILLYDFYNQILIYGQVILVYLWSTIFNPWPFRPKGYCRCLCPSVYLFVRSSVHPFVCLSICP